MVIENLAKREERHRKMLQDELIEDNIICSVVPPRRVWDLYSNRVAP